MAQIRHEESAKIINQAIAALGQGNKGLADRLNKDPSLVSRYASGAVRPKAETLLKCMDFIQEESGLVSVGMQSERDGEMYSTVKDVVFGLCLNKDADLIYTLFKVLQVAQKI